MCKGIKHATCRLLEEIFQRLRDQNQRPKGWQKLHQLSRSESQEVSSFSRFGMFRNSSFQARHVSVSYVCVRKMHERAVAYVFQGDDSNKLADRCDIRMIELQHREQGVNLNQGRVFDELEGSWINLFNATCSQLTWRRMLQNFLPSTKWNPLPCGRTFTPLHQRFVTSGNRLLTASTFPLPNGTALPESAQSERHPGKIRWEWWCLLFKQALTTRTLRFPDGEQGAL